MSNRGHETTEDRTLYVRRVPDPVWMSAKVAAAKRGISLREWIIEAVKEKVNREAAAGAAVAEGGDSA